MSILLIDNHDSYTWNLAHLVARVTGSLPRVVANDAIDLEGVRALDPRAIILSPGPGRPGVERDLGVSADILHHLDRPLLGVCLGHQGLAWAAGGRVVHAPLPMHGRISAIHHDGQHLFAGLPQGLRVVRYHSLMVQDLPPDLVACAHSDDGVIMALRHAHQPRYGVQFHPESIGTAHGQALIAAFLERAGQRTGLTPSPPAPRPPVPPGPTRVMTRRLDLVPNAETAFQALFHGRFCATWLDSSGRQGAGASRFSVLGAADGPLGQQLTWRHGEPVYLQRKGQPPRPSTDALEDAIRAPLSQHRADAELPFDFVGGWVGWFGYGCKARWGHGRPTPDATADVSLAFLDRVLVIDHLEQVTWLVALTRPGEASATRAWFNTTTSALADLEQAALPLLPSAPTAGLQPTVRHAAYLQAIAHAQQAIIDGESYEVCLTQRLLTGALASPLATHCALRRRNPAPYAAFLDHGEVRVVSCSPEQFLSVDRAGVVQARPIKGTTARHADPIADRDARDALQHSEKDRAENLMIVDLLRNDLGRVCAPGSVRVPSLMAVEPFATVHHLVSTIQGELQPQADALDAIIAAFPPGSMTGAPKERTVEILDALEPGPRGIYSGALGYLSVNGTADLSVVIRTLVCTDHGTSVGVGGAIIALSQPQAEWEEALLKARALDQVLTDDADPPAPGSAPVNRRFKFRAD